MKPKSIAIVGAAETTRLGVIPDMPVRAAHGPMWPPTLPTIPVLRYMETYGLTSNWRWSRSCSANGRRRTRGHLQDASASRASCGCLAITWRYAAAGASGWRRPCSQFFSVASGMR